MSMFDPAQLPSELRPIGEKVLEGQRISDEDALVLYRTDDLAAVGAMADLVRQRKNGEIATYVFNRYINYANICILACQFCAFGARKREDHAFEMAIPEVVATAEEAFASGATEIHMVGGLHPTLPPEWYLELVSSLRAISPDLAIKAFTAVEIRHLASRIFKRSIADTLLALREQGLNALTGGGAEIFAPDVRSRICRGKETAEEWAEVHRIWHELGGRSTCTMLYGHIEQDHHRVDHLARLRALQDITGGFTGFIPFAFEPEGARPELRDLPHAPPEAALRNLAVSRIYLDNIEHVTAYWVSLGLPLATEALQYGVDDLHGTIIEEKIFHMAGAKTPQQMTVEKLETAIRSAGRIPCQRNTFYDRIGSPGAGRMELAGA